MAARRIIGVITTVFESPFQTPLLDAIREEARKQQIDVLAIHADIQQISAIKLGYNVIDGWIEVARSIQAEQLLDSGRPVVVVSGINPLIDCVSPDNIGGASAAVQHLIDQGHTEIAFIGIESNSDFRQRRDGYRTTLSNAGIQANPALTINATGYVHEDGYTATQQLLAAATPFTAVFVASDWLALGVIDYLTEHGYRIPQDVAIVGFDDMLEARFTSPPLSSVRQDVYGLGVQAVQLLVQKLGEVGTQHTPQTVLIPTQLVLRESSNTKPNHNDQQALQQTSHESLQELHKNVEVFLTKENNYRLMILRDHELMHQINQPAVDPFSLEWLAALDSDWGMLALRSEEASPDLAPADRLQIVSTYSRSQGAEASNRSVALADFPPPEWIQTASDNNPEQVIKLISLVSTTRHWGFFVHSENLFRTEIDTTLQRQAYITSAFERAARQQTLQEAYQRERTLSATIRELGCPLIPLLPGVLLVPLIGTIDDQRASQIIETILEGVGREQASQVLLDITGVPLIDTQVAAALIRTAQAVGLLGARITLVGVRPEIAQSIVGLGIDLGKITTRPTLAVALRYLLQEQR